MKKIVTLCILFAGISAAFEGCFEIKKPIKLVENVPAEEPRG